MRVALLLAAGAGTRFGRPDKLLMPLGGRAVLLHALDCAKASGAARVIAVADPRYARRVRLLRRAGVAIVCTRAARTGMGASLAAGLVALRPIEREALIFLADMPFARAPQRLQLGQADGIRPVWRDRPGHPVLVRVAAARAAKPHGDRGLGGLRFASLIGRANALLDVDTRAGWRKARLLRNGTKR